MQTYKLDIIAGARPNFMKIAPIIKAIKRHNKQKRAVTILFRLIHTGQHFDENLSGVFFRELGIPKPCYNLHSGGGSAAEQTAQIMIGYEQLLNVNKPDICLVVGDVTSTMACAISAQKNQVKVAHVEAGIRSGDWAMPEEINRLLTDSISNYFFTTSYMAGENLMREGVRGNSIFFVGNTMIDTLLQFQPKFKAPSVWTEAQLQKSGYFVLTLHRPSNVDNPKRLKAILETVVKHSRGLPIVFSMHPRSAQSLKIESFDASNLLKKPPFGYFEFGFLLKHAKAVITDSGGISEETTVLSVPCLTLRDSTERPETVELGTNQLLGKDLNAIEPALKKVFDKRWKQGEIPEKWDGKASCRIVKILEMLATRPNEKPIKQLKILTVSE